MVTAASALTVDPPCLWKPSHPENTEMDKFRRYICKKHNLTLEDYPSLWRWSVTSLADFWTGVWEYTNIISSKRADRVLDLSVPLDAVPEWFAGARLNFAENLLWCRDATHTALIVTGEGQAEAGRRISYAELYEQVKQCAAALEAAGVGVGDRVAAYIPNCAEAIVAMLATISLGAIWSSTSPDFGTTGVLDRFEQIAPKVLFSVNAVVYNGKKLDHLAKLKPVAEGLRSSVKKVVVIPFVQDMPCALPGTVTWDAFLASPKKTSEPDTPIRFAQVPFNHPAFILFSSGTTGLPKCIVHSGGGLLLQLKKEHVIHGSMSKDDVFFYYTTTGWMMWNWLVAGLSVGATLVLWDGSPFKPSPIHLWKLVDRFGITHFGTSAKYLQSLQEAHVYPKNECKLTTLKAIYSTGSPLKPESFEFCYKHIKSDMFLGSITGGTDICSLFAGHNSALPVYRGEIQCICLGMKIEAWRDANQPVYAEAADLVCTAPFPCMPVYMYNDDAQRSKYKNAYFDVYKNVWYHGDYVWLNPRTGGVVMLGRSDGTLNPSGVRFGSAEIYNIVDRFTEIEDELCVGQKIKGEDDERVVLFVKMKPGVPFTDDLAKKIKTAIRAELSPRHVPAFVLPIKDIPYTINGKKVEVAVKKIISGQKVTPTGTLANPESLALYYDIPALAQ
ncbi:acetoacetate-CoA ligase [Dichotomocladium elegans]|nr:acetoacetate-CoA ligase [Dichotomocladium elegans]